MAETITIPHDAADARTVSHVVLPNRTYDDFTALPEGTVDEHGCVSVLGSYEAPPDPDWGWRIEVVPEGKSLRIIMHNISPDEQEVLAVRATYERTWIESALVCCETPISSPRDILTDRFKCCLQHRQISEQLCVNRAT